jgi:hypothetical protein
VSSFESVAAWMLLKTVVRRACGGREMMHGKVSPVTLHVELYSSYWH